MRKALAFLVVFHSFLFCGLGQPFRVATWQVPYLAGTGGATNPPPAGTVAPFQAIAAALSGADADVVILYGVADSQAAKQIGDSMRPRKFSVAHHGAFRHGGSRGPVVGLPFAILSARQRQHAKNFEWADTGRIDYPGGFAFATFRHGPSSVAVYVTILPGTLTNEVRSGDNDYISRKRDYAAQFVSAHAGWLATTYTNQIFATYLTGDINPDGKRFLKDDCALLLEKAGFRMLLPGIVADKSPHPVTNSQHLDRVLDPVFSKNVEFMASRQIVRPPPEPPIVICELTLKSSGVAAAAPVKRSSSSKPASPRPPAPAPEPRAAVVPAPVAVVGASKSAMVASNNSAALTKTAAPASPGSSPASGLPAYSLGSLLRERWFWPTVGGTTLALMALVFFGLRAGRRRRAPVALLRRPGDAVFVEMKPVIPRAHDAMPATGGPAVVSEQTTSTDNSHNPLWQPPPVQVRAQERVDPVRAGLMPHLRRLMREKLFMWLSHQRRQLIDSHETGTAQVLGLEERLERIKDQFQDRLVAQEERIAELDKELQEKERIIKEKLRREGQSSPSD